MKIATIIIVLVLACSIGRAQQFSTPLKLNTTAKGIADRSPMMHLGRDGTIYIAWVSGANSSGNGAIVMSTSSDGGTSFSAPVTVSAMAGCNSNFQRTAEFCIDTKGVIHLVWMANLVNNQPDIWYVRSSDKGQTWTTPITVCDADDSSKYAQDFPSIACDSSDNLYVSFLDSRRTQRTKGADNVHLYFTSSTDGGKSWSVNKQADNYIVPVGGTCECCAEKIAVSKEGHIYIVYRSNIENLRDIFLARSYNKGQTFETALKIQSGDWNITECPVSGPNLTLDAQENAHIVWRDQRDDSASEHLYYAMVPNASTLTPPNTAFDASGSSLINYPDVALFNNGMAQAIIYQTQNFDMRYILTAGGSTVVSNRPLRANSGSRKEFGHVLFAGDGTRYISWQDDGADNGDIYFCKETIALPTSGVTGSPAVSQAITTFPNPVYDRSFVLNYSITSPQSLKIYNLLGTEVFSTLLSESDHSKTIELPPLSKGMYEGVVNGQRVSLVIQ